MTVKRVVGMALAVLVGAGSLSAQARGWTPAKCDIKPGHYLVNSGVLYLINASKTQFDDQKRKDLQQAQQVLTQAVTSARQDKNAAAWYYLGRYYQMVADLPGADSAFAKAQALAPACREDIDFWRKFLWTPVFN